MGGAAEHARFNANTAQSGQKALGYVGTGISVYDSAYSFGEGDYVGGTQKAVDIPFAILSRGATPALTLILNKADPGHMIPYHSPGEFAVSDPINFVGAMRGRGGAREGFQLQLTIANYIFK